MTFIKNYSIINIQGEEITLNKRKWGIIMRIYSSVYDYPRYHYCDDDDYHYDDDDEDYE